ncbi:SLC13 family permease [Rhizobium tibeticum]|uniref:SLC13 family permease n=1 Tax=Rhizobium tibeticum TaxID=501024 RepID=UPI0027D7AA45|nr:SLC13 family permease [Rhizobium tibeticum]
MLGTDSVASIISRTSHILVFLVAVTIVADLCSAAGLFDAVGRYLARHSGGRIAVLFFGVSALGLFTTTVMSLDTTAVLLTPVVIRMAKNIRVSPLPFAMAAIWLANAGSLILPVSNLTNLLAMHRLQATPLEYLSVMWLPGLIAALVPVALLAIGYRKPLLRPYDPPLKSAPRDPILVRICGAVILAMLPAIVAGIPVEGIAVVALTVLFVVFAVRDRSALGWHLLPWRLIVLTVSLFIAMAGLSKVGAESLVASALGSSDDLVGLLRTAGVSALVANVFNNLPAYLLLETALPAEARNQLFGVLIGVNAGPGILMHGSLATLLWWDRCKKEGVDVTWRYFLAFGLVCVPLTLVSSVFALWFVLR